MAKEDPAETRRSVERDGWPELPDGGAGAFIPVTIGSRGALTEHDAQLNAEMWRAIVQRYPRAMFWINFMGYGDDPRELHEFPEVMSYVRWWARFSGMDDRERADSLIGYGSAIGLAGRTFYVASNMGLLTIAGVFGPEARDAALAQFKPTRPM